jgi:hypothetical protein
MCLAIGAPKEGIGWPCAGPEKTAVRPVLRRVGDGTGRAAQPDDAIERAASRSLPRQPGIPRRWPDAASWDSVRVASGALILSPLTDPPRPLLARLPSVDDGNRGHSPPDTWLTGGQTESATTSGGPWRLWQRSSGDNPFVAAVRLVLDRDTGSATGPRYALAASPRSLRTCSKAARDIGAIFDVPNATSIARVTAMSMSQAALTCLSPSASATPQTTCRRFRGRLDAACAASTAPRNSNATCSGNTRGVLASATEVVTLPH